MGLSDLDCRPKRYPILLSTTINSPRSSYNCQIPPFSDLSLNALSAIKDASTIYNVRIESHYTEIGGAPVSGHYTITYEEL